MSHWTLVVLRDAEKMLLKLTEQERLRIIKALDILSATGPYNCSLDVKRLRGSLDWRLRVGRWRVIFRVDHGNITILVVSVSPRGDAYK